MVSDGCVFQPMVVDLLLNPRHIRHSRLSSRCPLCKRNSERNPPSMTSTIDYWFMWRCTFFKIWTVSNASACATKSPCWSSLPHPRRCALVGSWWSPSYLIFSSVLYFKLTCSMALAERLIQLQGACLGWRCGSKVSPCVARFNAGLCLHSDCQNVICDLRCSKCIAAKLVRNIDLCQGCWVSWRLRLG
jgi:hypothetical protein